MSTQKQPPYMFSKPIVDYFFRWRWWASSIVFAPMFLALLIGAWFFADSYWQIAVFFIIGIFLWTLFEYIMHRFLFHSVGKTPGLRQLHYVVHGMHHAFPNDPLRIIFPPFLSFFIGSLIACVFLLMLPLAYAMSVMSGFLLGYVAYEFIHYSAHHIKWKRFFFYERKRYHLLHHHNDHFSGKNFGVTTSFWDKVFNTF